MARESKPLSGAYKDGGYWDGTYDNPVHIITGETGAMTFGYTDANGNYWEETHYPDGRFELRTTDSPDNPFDLDSWREAEEGEEPMGHISQGQQAPPPFEGYVPLPPDQPIGEVLGGPPKTYNPPDDFSDKKLSDFQQKTYVPPAPDEPGYVPLPPDEPVGGVLGGPPKTYNPPDDPKYTDRLPPEPDPPPPPAQGGPQDPQPAPPPPPPPPPGESEAGGGILGIKVPYLDILPFFPVGQDPATGEWRYEQAHDPELARKWAEERGIEPPPQLPPSEQAQYLDLAQKWAEDLGIKLPPLPPPEQAPGGTRNPPPAPEERANDGSGSTTAAGGGASDGGTAIADASGGDENIAFPDQRTPDAPAPETPAPTDATAGEPMYTKDLQIVEPGDPRLGTHPKYVTRDEVEPDPNAQPTPPAPPPDWDGDGDGIPNEYGDGPDLDGNGIPDEVGINPDSLQPGYPGGETGGATIPDPAGQANGNTIGVGDINAGGNSGNAVGVGDTAAGATLDPIPSASVEWGGVGVPGPGVVPQSDATTTGAEAVPEEYGGGSSPDADWGIEESGIDPYAFEQPDYADPPASGDDGTGDPYGGGSSFEPYTPPEEAPLEEEAPVAEGEDPNALGSF